MGGSDPVATLSNGTVSIPSGFGNALAQVVADLLATIRAGQQAIQNANLTSIKPLSSLPSGTQLADRFSKQGTTLSQLLDDNAAILEELGPAFIEAEKAYQSATEAAAREFDKIQTHAGLGTIGPPPKYNPNATNNPFTSGHPTKFVPGRNGVPNNHDPIAAEPGSSLGLNDMQTFAQHGLNAPAAEQGQTWNWLGSGLSKAAGDFVSGLSSASAEWSGSGKNAAIAACQAYAGSLQQLGTEVTQVGNAMQYAVWQIDQAISAMEAAMAGWDGKNDNTATTARNNGIRVINSQYDPGVTYSSEGLPPSLTKPTNPLRTTPGHDDGSGGGRGGAPGPATSNGSSTSDSTSRPNWNTGPGVTGAGNGGGGNGGTGYPGSSYGAHGSGPLHEHQTVNTNMPSSSNTNTPSGAGNAYYAAAPNTGGTGTGTGYQSRGASGNTDARGHTAGSYGNVAGSDGAGASGHVEAPGTGYYAGSTSGPGYSGVHLRAANTSGIMGSGSVFHSGSGFGATGSGGFGFGSATGISGSGAASGAGLGSFIGELAALATSLVEQAASFAPQLMQQLFPHADVKAGDPGAKAGDVTGNSPLSEFSKLLDASSGGGSGGGPAGFGTGIPSYDAPAYQAPSHLFPRATATAFTADDPVGTAGQTDPSLTGAGAGGMPMGGMGGGMGGGGKGGGGGSKEHKTAENLNSTANMDEAFGDQARATRPVMDVPIKGRRRKDDDR